jgi:hypothetical protein
VGFPCPPISLYLSVFFVFFVSLWSVDAAVSAAADARGRAIVAAAEAGFQLSHAGCQVRRLLQEAYGPQHVAFIKAAGLLLKSDYAEYYVRTGTAEPPLPLHERPYLMGLEREDVENTLPGTAGDTCDTTWKSCGLAQGRPRAADGRRFLLNCRVSSSSRAFFDCT